MLCAMQEERKREILKERQLVHQWEGERVKCITEYAIDK